jgi:hypothetical protein
MQVGGNGRAREFFTKHKQQLVSPIDIGIKQGSNFIFEAARNRMGTTAADIDPCPLV